MFIYKWLTLFQLVLSNKLSNQPTIVLVQNITLIIWGEFILLVSHLVYTLWPSNHVHCHLTTNTIKACMEAFLPHNQHKTDLWNPEPPKWHMGCNHFGMQYGLSWKHEAYSSGTSLHLRLCWNEVDHYVGSLHIEQYYTYTYEGSLCYKI